MADEEQTGPRRGQPSAEESYPELFEFLDTTISTFNDWLLADDTVYDATIWNDVAGAILHRALNLYRSGIYLLRQNHWEEATVLSRSLFELLLSVEHLQRSEDLEASARSYWAYGLLEELIAAKANLTYTIESGRGDDQTRQRLTEIETQMRSPAFAEFKTKRGEWQTGWSGQSVWNLAKASSHHLRVRQYNVLYRDWSRFVHSSPRAVLANAIQPQYHLGHPALALIYANVIEKRGAFDTAGMLVALTVEILIALSQRLAHLDQAILTGFQSSSISLMMDSFTEETAQKFRIVPNFGAYIDDENHLRTIWPQEPEEA